ncbi:MAG: DNA polymerase III subunit delta [Rhizobiales bacterium]|nr:DNA polymerase III subunit delta [Hyphomicrobiales bacterium]
MPIMKVNGLEALVGRRNPGVGAVLLYGSDPSAIHDLARRLVAKIVDGDNDPLAIAYLDEQSLAGDPGRLIDEVQSLSLLGGNRVVWVRGAEQNFLRAVEPVLDGSTVGNLIVAEAGNLAKTSALRTRFEASSYAAIVPLYEASEGDAMEALQDNFRSLGLKIADAAAMRLVELVGKNLTLLRREAEKLAAYCHTQATVERADVEAVCGDSMEAELDELLDVVFGGQVEEADRSFFQAISAGTDAGRILSAIQSHAQRLIDLQLTAERGMKVEQAIRSARPPIFFKRQPALLSQIRAWRTDGLLLAASTLATAIERARLEPGLAMGLAHRTLLGIAQTARKAQRN